MSRYYFGEKKLKEGEKKIVLRYYLCEDTVGAEYYALKSYGVEIIKIEEYDGRQMKETKKIPGIFFNRREAEDFLEAVMKKRTQPLNLNFVLEEYVHRVICREVTAKGV